MRKDIIVETTNVKIFLWMSTLALKKLFLLNRS